MWAEAGGILGLISTARSTKLKSFLALCLIGCLPLVAGVAGCRAHRQSYSDLPSADSGGSVPSAGSGGPGGAGQTVDYAVTEVGPAQTPEATPPGEGQASPDQGRRWSSQTGSTFR